MDSANASEAWSTVTPSGLSAPASTGEVGRAAGVGIAAGRREPPMPLSAEPGGPAGGRDRERATVAGHVAPGPKGRSDGREVREAHVAAGSRRVAPRAYAHPGPTAQTIIWIASYPKSGNTWVRAFIHNLMLELRGESDTVQDINRMGQHTAWEILPEPYEAILGRKTTEVPQAEIARVRPEVQRRLANSRTGPFLVKTHLCRSHDYGVPTINLDATLAAIYIVRNPLDVAVSYSHHSGHSLDCTIHQLNQLDFRTVNREDAVFELVGSWSVHVASWLSCFQRPVLLLKYEDLLKHPMQQFDALARFLQLSPSKAQIRAAMKKSSFTELRRQEEIEGFCEKPATSLRFFREGREVQWCERLTFAQMERVVEEHAPMMQRYCYIQPHSGGKFRIQPIVVI